MAIIIKQHGYKLAADVESDLRAWCGETGDDPGDVINELLRDFFDRVTIDAETPEGIACLANAFSSPGRRHPREGAPVPSPLPAPGPRPDDFHPHPGGAAS